MATIRNNDGSTTKTSRRHPPRTVEEAENQNILLAMELARKQLEEGRASSQVITHFLKLGTIKAKYEEDNLRKQNDLLTAKTGALKSQQNSEKMYEKAISAMKKYNGETDNEDSDDNY